MNGDDDCWGANGELDCGVWIDGIEETENGDGDESVVLGSCGCPCGGGGWNALDFANGFVGERLSVDAPVGFPSSLGSAMPVGWGIMDWRKGLVDVCWAESSEMGASPLKEGCGALLGSWSEG